MSESDTEAEGNKGGPKRPPGRRAKPPVTIDLTAAESAKTESGKTPDPAPNPPKTSPASAVPAAGAKPTAADPPPSDKQGGEKQASEKSAAGEKPSSDKPATNDKTGSDKPIDEGQRPPGTTAAATMSPVPKSDEPKDAPKNETPRTAQSASERSESAPASAPIPRQVSPIPTRAERPKTDWSSAGRLIAAGVFGGAIATVLGILYHASGIIPTRADLVAADAVRQAQTTAEKVAAFESRLAALESATDGLGALTEKVTSLEKLEDTNRSRIENLENAMPVAGSGGSGSPPVSLGPLESRLSEAESDIKTLGDRIGTLTGRVEEIAARPPPAVESERAARAVAIGLLRQGAASGHGFASDLSMLKALGLDDADVAALEPLAENGAPTVAELQASFPAVADAIVTATSQLGPDAGFVDRLFAFGNGLVSVRPTGPIEGDTPDAVVSRMEDAVRRGDLAAALAERDKLPAEGQNASATWAAAASDRIQIDTIVERLAQSIAPPPAN